MKSVIIYLLSSIILSNSCNHSVVFNKYVLKHELVTLLDVLKYMDEVGIYNSEIVLKQIKLESNNLNSNLYHTNCNPFGMKIPYIRKSMAINLNTKDTYSKYNNLRDAILDYKLYQKYFNIVEDEGYTDKLEKNRYAEDPEYGSKIRRIRI